LFRTRFYDEETGSLREYFGPRWEVGPDCGSERLEPGHHMEWVWLLRRYARASAAEVAPICARLFANAERLGRDSATGFLVDEVDPGGRRLIERRRLWPQTEYLKALLVQLEATGERRLLEAAGALVEGMLASYLAGTVPGGWCDQFTLAGEPTTAFMPASSLYHLFVPAIEIACLEPAAAG
jgi:mannose/cellobiose epimerase-like protein (N-acyl-D-glucosamine 2-epimerase family)